MFEYLAREPPWLLRRALSHGSRAAVVRCMLCEPEWCRFCALWFFVGALQIKLSCFFSLCCTEFFFCNYCDYIDSVTHAVGLIFLQETAKWTRTGEKSPEVAPPRTTIHPCLTCLQGHPPTFSTAYLVSNLMNHSLFAVNWVRFCIFLEVGTSIIPGKFIRVIIELMHTIRVAKIINEQVEGSHKCDAHIQTISNVDFWSRILKT